METGYKIVNHMFMGIYEIETKKLIETETV